MDMVREDVVHGWAFQGDIGCISGESRRRGVDIDIDI
jgi:hypothetical protein